MVRLRKHLWRIALIAAVPPLAAGCVEPLDDPGPAPALPAQTPAESVPGVTATPAGPRYDATGLDLCARTDLTPLAEFDLEITERKVPELRSGPACFWEMRTPNGQTASLSVEAATFPSLAEAASFYEVATGPDAMTVDGEIDGLGDEAVGFTQRRSISNSHDEYRVNVRAGNLVAKVWIALETAGPTPKQSLSAKAVEMAQDLITIVPIR